MTKLTLQWPITSIEFVPSRWRPILQSHLIQWLERQRQRIHLSHLELHMLEDIGVSRTDAEKEARKWS